jgi:imidazolonepropionase-like amidohydrolase
MTTALTGGDVLRSDGSVQRADVVIDGERIIQVGQYQATPDGQTIDVGGCLVLPGFIDAHTHISHGYAGVEGDTPAGQGIRAAARARRALQVGITSVRELGSYRQVDMDLRRAINEGWTIGPRMLCAGEYVNITGGHGHPKGRRADGPDEVRKAVREQLLAGADVIKLMCSGGAARADESPDAAQFTAAEIAAAVDEAHLAGKPLAAHAHPTRSIRWALEAGADSIEHGTFLDDWCIDFMAQHDVFLVPTLAVYRHIATSGHWPHLQARAAQLLEAKVLTLQKAVAAGVRWAVGTDTSAFFPLEDFVEELRQLAFTTGIGPAGVLQAATLGNARLLGLAEVGSVEPGYLADLVVVAGDPLADLSALRNVRMTVARGQVLEWASAAV